MAFGLVLIIYCMDVCLGKSGVVREWTLMTSFVTICLTCSFISVSGDLWPQIRCLSRTIVLGRTPASRAKHDVIVGLNYLLVSRRFTCFIYLHCIMYDMWSFFFGVVPQALHVCCRRDCRSGLVLFVRLFDLYRFPTSREFTGIETHRLVNGSCCGFVRLKRSKKYV
ncbi:hypothetical protein JB92DRAFT_3033531 [Gautieria morchelliformis]|nr:hypothetical protein JB92DRAFT_3033531 [Gautieria morchelliformis]